MSYQVVQCEQPAAVLQQVSVKEAILCVFGGGGRD